MLYKMEKKTKYPVQKGCEDVSNNVYLYVYSSIVVIY